MLFEWQQAVEAYDFCQKQMLECDRRLQTYLAGLPSRSIAPPEEAAAAETAASTSPEDKDKGRKKRRGRGKPRKNEPKFNLEGVLARICGVNLATIDGVDVMTIETFVFELGVDMTPWRTEDHLVSWLKLAPNRQISGGKVIKQERSKAKTRVADALRMAASTLIRSESYLGARFRHLRGRLGPGKAVKAMAAHLARLIYRMLTHGPAWVDRGAQEYQNRRQEREKLSLQRKATALGFRLVPAA